jgi:aspartate/methionine/tyrosine aminotransferase
VEAARRVSTHTIFNVPVTSQRVALAALRAGPAWVEKTRDEYRAARDRAVHALAGAPVRFSVCEGGSYLFLDFNELLCARPLTDLLERAIQHGVLLAPGDAFGAGFERWARLCFTAVPPADVVRGIERLRRAMDEIAQG